MGQKKGDSNFTQNDKTTLWGLCRLPWANDRQIAEDVKMKMSTVTACKNRLRREGVYRKAYIPAYHYLGYPLISYSQLNWKRPSEEILKTLTKYNDSIINIDNPSRVSFIINDPLNVFVIAHHKDYTSFRIFVKEFNDDDDWNHKLYTMEKATRILNFDYSNTINKMFFPGRYETVRPITINIGSYKFSKIERKAFDGLLVNQEENSNTVSKKIKITRQSIIKMQRKFRKDGVLERSTITELKSIGIKIVGVIKFRADVLSNKEINIINRKMEPFYYWVFDDSHYLLSGFGSYENFLQGYAEVSRTFSLENTKIQLFNMAQSNIL